MGLIMLPMCTVCVLCECVYSVNVCVCVCLLYVNCECVCLCTETICSIHPCGPYIQEMKVYFNDTIHGLVSKVS